MLRLTEVSIATVPWLLKLLYAAPVAPVVGGAVFD